MTRTLEFEKFPIHKTMTLHKFSHGIHIQIKLRAPIVDTEWEELEDNEN